MCPTHDIRMVNRNFVSSIFSLWRYKIYTPKFLYVMKAEPRYTILFDIFFQKSTDTTKYSVLSLNVKSTAKLDVGVRTHIHNRWMEYVYESSMKSFFFCCVWQFSYFDFLKGFSSFNNAKVKFSKKKTFFKTPNFQTFKSVVTENLFFKVCAIQFTSQYCLTRRNCKNTSALYEI